MKKILATAALFLFIISGSAQAMTREEILSEITRLTAVAEVIAGQIRALGASPASGSGAGSGTTTGSVGAGGTARFDSSSVCTRITTTLRQGQTSSAVVSLQDALASVGVFTGSSTGYFGPVTAAAVRQFQNVNGIVATGSVGPETAQALYQACTGGSTYSAAGNGSGSGAGVAPVDRSSLSVTPQSGRAPLSVTALFAINGTTCSSYTLDWGDNTPPVSRTGATSGCITDNINRQLAHMYLAPGTYSITLRTIRGNINSAPVVAQSAVTVQ
jgi:Putative peptidoglycan binding domain